MIRIYQLLTILCLLLVTQTVALAQKRPYIFATYTYSTNTRLQNLEPLARYLSEQTGHAIVARSYPSVNALIQAMLHDSVDFAMINTLGYLVVQHKYPDLVKPMLTLDMGDIATTQYGGCLIARKDAPFKTMQDLTGLSNRPALGLVNSSSTSGNLVPRLLLNRAGITNADAAFELSYRGTHKSVVEDVLSGKITLGGCGCAEVDSARKYLAFNKKAFVVDSFEDIPLGPVVRHHKTSKEVARDISRALLRVHEEQFAVFATFRDGWTEFREAKKFRKVKDRRYHAFRRMFGKNQRLWQVIE